MSTFFNGKGHRNLWRWLHAAGNNAACPQIEIWHPKPTILPATLEMASGPARSPDVILMRTAFRWAFRVAGKSHCFFQVNSFSHSFRAFFSCLFLFPQTTNTSCPCSFSMDGLVSDFAEKIKAFKREHSITSHWSHIPSSVSVSLFYIFRCSSTNELSIHI